MVVLQLTLWISIWDGAIARYLQQATRLFHLRLHYSRCWTEANEAPPPSITAQLKLWWSVTCQDWLGKSAPTTAPNFRVTVWSTWPIRCRTETTMYATSCCQLSTPPWSAWVDRQGWSCCWCAPRARVAIDTSFASTATTIVARHPCLSYPPASSSDVQLILSLTWQASPRTCTLYLTASQADVVKGSKRRSNAVWKQSLRGGWLCLSAWWAPWS